MSRMTEVCLWDAPAAFAEALAPPLAARGMALAAQDAPGGDVVVLAGLVPALMVHPDAASASAALSEDTLAGIERRIAGLEAARVVLISVAQPEGPGTDGTGPVRAAGLRIEAALAARCGPKSVVLRVSDIMDPSDPGLQAAVRGLMGGGGTDWPRTERIQPIALTDLAAAVCSAAQAGGGLGHWYDIALPEAIDRYTLAGEAHRLVRLLSDPDQTEIQERPPYPPVEPLRDTSPAQSALHTAPRRSAWALLAETVQILIRQGVASGAIAPIRPPMPEVHHALETGGLPLAGRHVLLTGASSGIGRAAVPILVRLGADVIGIGRNAEAGEALEAEIEAARPAFARRQLALAAAEAARSGKDPVAGSPGTFRFVAVDLSDIDALRPLSARIAAAAPRLDAVLHCAGAVFAERQETPAGMEATLAVNLVAPVTLTRLLAAPLVAAGAGGGARVITLVSDAHAEAPIDLNDLQSRMSYAPAEVLARCKAGLVMMTTALAETTQGTGVSTLAVSLPPVRTNLMTPLDEPLTGGPTQRQRQQTQRQQSRNQMISPAIAAAQVVNALVSNDFRGQSGVLIANEAVAEIAPHCSDRDRTAELWQAVSLLGGLVA